MQKIAQFEKVSFLQFYESMRDEHSYRYRDGDELFQATNHQYGRIKLPKRSTVGSAGYDFFSPISFTLTPGETIKIPTGVRVAIDNGWFLMCAPRSGQGFKYFARLANTIGVVDSDYYFSDNEGHIFVKIRNEGEKNMEVKQGEAFCQGIFLPFGITHDDNTDGVRNGGFGSTDKLSDGKTI